MNNMQNIYSHLFIDDDAEKVTSEPHDTCTLKTVPVQKKREDLTESTGVVLAEYPPKVKLKLFSQL